MTLRHYQGSCHCGASRFEADIDLAAGTNRCNCSACSKARAWFAFVPAEHFRLVREDALTDYRWTPPAKKEPFLTYRFCSRCGVRLFATGEAPQFGGRFYAVHLPTLDNVDADELAAAPIHFADGRHDRFDTVPADTRLL
jgi:hypothetical protein